MAKILKLVGGLVLVLAVIVGAAAVYVYLNGSGLIRDGVSTYGPEVTGTSVKLDGVSLSPISGDAGLKGLEIGSPAGFTAPYTFKFNTVDVALEPKSLFGDVIHVRRIAIDSPAIAFEPKRGGSNLDALQRNIEAFTAQNIGTTEQSGSSTKKITIRELTIRNAQVLIAAANYGLGEKTLTLADITLRDIGIKEGGVPPAEAARLAMDAIKPQVTKILASSEGKRLLNEALGGKIDLDQSLEDQAKDAVTKKLKKGLKGLLGEKESETREN